MRPARLSALAAIAVTTCAFPMLNCTAAGASARELYVLAGQSNMSGLGKLASLTDSEKIIDPAIRLYGNDGRWKPALDPLDDATDQVDAVSTDKHAGVGPGLFFAREMRRIRTASIDVVPCAKDGSAIDQWGQARARGTLYGSCMARIDEAGGRPTGILWYQGEADTRTMALANAWRVKFVALVKSMRHDLGQPRLPVVLVELSDRDPRPEGAARYPGWQTVQAAQRNLDVHCVTTVSATGLAQNPDRLHLATEGQRILGRRIADAMAALQARGCESR